MGFPGQTQNKFGAVISVRDRGLGPGAARFEALRRVDTGSGKLPGDRPRVYRAVCAGPVPPRDTHHGIDSCRGPRLPLLCLLSTRAVDAHPKPRVWVATRLWQSSKVSCLWQAGSDAPEASSLFVGPKVAWRRAEARAMAANEAWPCPGSLVPVLEGPNLTLTLTCFQHCALTPCVSW